MLILDQIVYAYKFRDGIILQFITFGPRYKII